MRFLPLLLALACGTERRVQRQERRDTAELGAAAASYWEALRWGNLPRAASFLATPEAKLAFAHEMADPQVRYTDAQVLQVVVHEGEPRRGTAVVRVERYSVWGSSLQVETIEQEWVEQRGGWVIDPAPP